MTKPTRQFSVALLFFLCFALLSPAVSANAYRWVDDQGTVHFVDDVNRIPPEFRDRAQEINDRGVPVEGSEKSLKEQEEELKRSIQEFQKDPATKEQPGLRTPPRQKDTPDSLQGLAKMLEARQDNTFLMVTSIVLSLLSILCFVVAMIWFLVKAFQESLLWGLGVLLVPCVNVVFLFMHFDQAKKPFLVGCMGAIFLFANVLITVLF